MRNSPKVFRKLKVFSSILQTRSFVLIFCWKLCHWQFQKLHEKQLISGLHLFHLTFKIFKFKVRDKKTENEQVLNSQNFWKSSKSSAIKMEKKSFFWWSLFFEIWIKFSETPSKYFFDFFGTIWSKNFIFRIFFKFYYVKYLRKKKTSKSALNITKQ